MPTISYSQVIDISLPLGEGFVMPTPPGFSHDVQFSVEVLRDYDDPGADGKEGQIVRAAHMRLHAGTHFDAPSHFDKAGKNVSDYDPALFIGPAVMSDVSDCGANTAITPEMVSNGLPRPLRSGDRLLVRTDWNERYGEAGWQEDSPYLTKEAIDLIAGAGVAMCGIDYCHHKSDPTTVWAYLDRALGKVDALLIPYLVHLGQIPVREFTLLVAPIKVVATEAAPVRALVLL